MKYLWEHCLFRQIFSWMGQWSSERVSIAWAPSQVPSPEYYNVTAESMDQNFFIKKTVAGVSILHRQNVINFWHNTLLNCVKLFGNTLQEATDVTLQVLITSNHHRIYKSFQIGADVRLTTTIIFTIENKMVHGHSIS